MADQTVTEKFQAALARFEHYRSDTDKFSGRKNEPKYQVELLKLIKEFRIIAIIVDQLGLFSDNESVDELNVNYIPFLNVDYYLGNLFQNLIIDWQSVGEDVTIDGMEDKVENLRRAQEYYASYIVKVSNYQLLNSTQTAKINAFKKSDNPTPETILLTLSQNPAVIRAEKIANFKLEKELNAKIQILFDRYAKNSNEAKEIFTSYDEDTVKQLYLDQIQLFVLKAFGSLELTGMELSVLKNMPRLPKEPRAPMKEKKEDPTGYTEHLEKVPGKKEPMSALLSKQGKILQPFTITSSKDELRQKVFGTGQVLPSMTVEEYLDYELANGKMMKEEVKDNLDEKDEEDSEEEEEKRRWDDWKDDNPKGQGNTGANIG